MGPDEFTFLFVDLAGYTALSEVHGDQRAAATATRLTSITKTALTGGARLVKALGDGVMVVGPSIEPVVLTAREVFRVIRREPEFPAARMGIHGGHAIQQDGDFFGAAVNLSARLMERAQPGQALCSEKVALALGRHEMVGTRPLGTVRLKHIVQPVAIYELLFEAPGNALTYVDPVCRMQVDREGSVARSFEGTLVRFCSRDCERSFLESPEMYLEQY